MEMCSLWQGSAFQVQAQVRKRRHKARMGLLRLSRGCVTICRWSAMPCGRVFCLGRRPHRDPAPPCWCWCVRLSVQAISAASSFTTSLLNDHDELMQNHNFLDGDEPWLPDLLSEARHDDPVGPSRLA